ncbi:MAG: N-6 DNA methylase [Gemmatimonadetes bacterium]|nr:N-6 DNA methylase [Gemmatimonadota bacterium]
MDAARLRQLRCAADLPGLFAPGGGLGAARPLPPGTLPLPVSEAVEFGLPGRLPWIGVATRGALTGARHLSQALQAQGRLAGVLALDPVGRQLAAALTLDRYRGLAVPLDAPSGADLQRLAGIGAIAQSASAPLAAALALADLLGTEEVGHRFFRAFQAVADRMAEGLTPAPPRGTGRTLALVQLTRVLFLYFVQARGWLDGRPDFLRRSVDDTLASRRSLHRDLFRPLFFGTLNQPPERRRRARRFGRIPFLNGGLFEPHPLERAWRGDVPTACWRDAFDALFERFRFVVAEDEVPGAIAPDMLGRVFEGLMAPDERRESGAFYTPAPVVRQLVDAALTSWVAEQAGVRPATAREQLARADPGLGAVLADIRLLDPAVGSGAFLLGALERLAGLRAGEGPPAALRRSILASNLHGVDLNPMAVRLTELRLWLAVIAVEPAGPDVAVAPLPNLDGLIRQGDSLLDPAGFLARLGARPVRSAPELRRLREAFVGARGEDKRALLARLRHAEARALEECLQRAGASLEAGITDCLLAARAPTLFGGRRGLDAPLRRELRRLRAQLAQVRRLRRRLVREGEVPWFSYEVHFGDVLARGGFDLVVGNPPWVRAEELAPGTRAALDARYRWWRARGPGFAHQPDLALAFVERGVELLAPGGVLALLLPAKLATAAYAATMRRALAEQCTLHTLADLTRDPAAAFDATAYPLALVAARRAPPAAHRVQLALRPATGVDWPQERFRQSGPWIIAHPALLEALATLHGDHPRLGERYPPQLGVKTGANAVFLDPPPGIEPALLRRALRGRDLAPFRHGPGVPLFFPHDATGQPFGRLPEGAARYLRPHEAILRARVDYDGGPPWTLFRVRPALAAHRVVWPDLARALAAVALGGPGAGSLVPLNTCYVLAVPDRRTALALAAWLNSTWLRVAARAAADVAASGFARFNARVVGGLPLPDAVPSDARLVALAERGARGEPIQEALDDLAAAHLALPPAVRALLARAPGAHAPDRG